MATLRELQDTEKLQKNKIYIATAMYGNTKNSKESFESFKDMSQEDRKYWGIYEVLDPSETFLTWIWSSYHGDGAGCRGIITPKEEANHLQEENYDYHTGEPECPALRVILHDPKWFEEGGEK